MSGELKGCLVDCGKSVRGICQSWIKNRGTSNGNGRGFEEEGRGKGTCVERIQVKS